MTSHRARAMSRGEEVAVVCDQPVLGDALVERITDAGFHVAASGRALFEVGQIAATSSPDIVVVSIETDDNAVLEVVCGLMAQGGAWRLVAFVEEVAAAVSYIPATIRSRVALVDKVAGLGEAIAALGSFTDRLSGSDLP